MELKRLRLLFVNIFFVVPCLCQLPAFPMPGDASTEPPPASNHQQPPPAQTVLVPKVDFDFKGFFDYFVKIYGKNALSVFQEKLDVRKTEEGLVVSSVPGVPIPCALAQHHSGASLTYENPNRAHGSTATYRCDVGYKGTDIIVMCVSGSWTSANVSCELVFCGRPGPMPNGRVNFQDVSYGATATYTCEPGFQADDIASPVRCQADGTWSKPTFRCANMMASTQHMSTQMASGGMGGMMGNMAAMMQAMSGGSGGMAGSSPGASGLNSGLMGAIAQAMGSGTPGAGGAAGGGLGAMMSSMMGNPMGGGGAGSVGTAALPEHLQMLGNMAPALMPNFLGGLSPNFGAAGGMGGGAGQPPLEPEQQRDQMMMIAMMQTMQRQRMMEMQRQRQQELQRQQEAQKQQQQQQQQQQGGGSTSNAINLANLIPLASGTPGAQTQNGNTGTSSATASMMTALQSLQTALSQMMGSQAPGTGTGAAASASSGSASASSSSGSSQPTSVFGSSSSSSTSGTDALRDAVMAAGLSSG